MDKEDEQVMRNGLRTTSRGDAKEGVKEGLDQRINNDGRTEVARGEARREREASRTTVVKSDLDGRNLGPSKRCLTVVHSDRGGEDDAKNVTTQQSRRLRDSRLI